MKKKIIALLGMTVMSCALVTGCGGSKTPAAESEAATEAPAEEQEGTDALTEEQTSDEADAQEETEEKTAAAVLEDGTYTAEFDTDNLDEIISMIEKTLDVKIRKEAVK